MSLISETRFPLLTAADVSGNYEFRSRSRSSSVGAMAGPPPVGFMRTNYFPVFLGVSVNEMIYHTILFALTCSVSGAFSRTVFGHKLAPVPLPTLT